MAMHCSYSKLTKCKSRSMYKINIKLQFASSINHIHQYSFCTNIQVYESTALGQPSKREFTHKHAKTNCAMKQTRSKKITCSLPILMASNVMRNSIRRVLCIAYVRSATCRIMSNKVTTTRTLNYFCTNKSHDVAALMHKTAIK
jgi:hypothetical protein